MENSSDTEAKEWIANRIGAAGCRMFLYARVLYFECDYRE